MTVAAVAATNDRLHSRPMPNNDTAARWIAWIVMASVRHDAARRASPHAIAIDRPTRSMMRPTTRKKANMGRVALDANSSHGASHTRARLSKDAPLAFAPSRFS